LGIVLHKLTRISSDGGSVSVYWRGQGLGVAGELSMLVVTDVEGWLWGIELHGCTMDVRGFGK
jgi:hypothetical protein